jgi:vacuolar-type H+-ATPase subunit C/Vma6
MGVASHLMRQSLPLIFVLYLSNANPQHTNNYTVLIKPLNKIETEIDTIFYGNGKPKFITERTKFEIDNEVFKTNIGTKNVFYRNGKIARKTKIDDFSNYLIENLFDRNGNLTEEWITTKINNQAESLTDFINEKSFGDFIKEINYYTLK